MGIGTGRRKNALGIDAAVSRAARPHRLRLGGEKERRVQPRRLEDVHAEGRGGSIWRMSQQACASKGRRPTLGREENHGGSYGKV